MKNYIKKSVIPTASDSTGLCQIDSDIYFSSHTNIYKLDKNKFTLYSHVKGTVIGFVCFTTGTLRLTLSYTRDRIYLIGANGRILGTLKKQITALAITEDGRYFSIAIGGNVEVWKVPTSYKTPLFDRISHITGHLNDITKLEFLNDQFMLSISNDGTIRISDIVEQTSKMIYRHRCTPINIHVIEKEPVLVIYVICEDGAIIHLKYENNKTEIISKDYTEILVLYSFIYKENLILCTENEIINRKENKAITINNKIKEIRNKENILLIRTEKEIQSYDLEKENFNFKFPLPEIICYTQIKEKIIIGCRDNQIRIYENDKYLDTFNNDAQVAIQALHATYNMVVAVCWDGSVRAYDINNGYCFRSFKIPLSVCSSVITQEGEILLLADQTEYHIHVVDLKRSKAVDMITGQCGPVVRMLFHRDYLYFLTMDSTLTKYNLFNSNRESITKEGMINFTVGMGMIAVATDRKIYMYDMNLELMSSFKCALKARMRSELYMMDKAPEWMAFSPDDRLLVVGGLSNTVMIIHLETGKIVQRLKVSNNKEWENYKERLGRELDTKFDKTKIIETRGLTHTRMLFIMSREGISIYERSSIRFDPVELECEVTPESAYNELKKRKYLHALVIGAKLGNMQFMDEIVKEIPNNEVEGVVKYFPIKFVSDLRRCITKLVERGYITGMLWFRYIVFYHRGIGCESIDGIKKVIENILKDGRKKFYLSMNKLN
ncbi:Periodic tryptophan protein 2 like protein [Astathelohania contejeani]|uniref:Periodic tryptophan protein 2 like protein n=1 Tax=Astathelohania contejeani TaxID=164912 RepID=A0ABQ7HZM7_9MICR|nr:Periodic tryptophan protein 2 like protein [Thelohania contejeani]